MKEEFEKKGYTMGEDGAGFEEFIKEELEKVKEVVKDVDDYEGVE